MKQYLSCAPLLAKPILGERLFIYLSVSAEATSAVLVTVRERKHLPIYYLSKTLQGAEKKYAEIEKFDLALINASRRLRPYFQAHSITVLTDQPLKQVLAKPNMSGRLIKWSIELSQFDISFEPRATIQAQAVADLLVERFDLGLAESKDEGVWLMHTDGSSTS